MCYFTKKIITLKRLKWLKNFLWKIKFIRDIEIKNIINLKNEDKGFDAIDVILNDKNFLKMEDNLENDKKNK